MLFLPLLGEVLNVVVAHPGYWRCAALCVLARTLYFLVIDKVHPVASK